MRNRRVAVALVAATLAATIVAIATTNLRDQPLATGSPAVSASASASSAAQPRVLFAHHVVLDTVPGGGPMITDAYDSIEVMTPGGARQSHAIRGVSFGKPVFDGRDRVAYWRGASIGRPSGKVGGPYEVVVLELNTGREGVLLAQSDERATGGLLWSADGKSLLIVPGFATTTGGTATRPVLINANGISRQLPVDVSPIFIDAEVMVGVTRSSYVVVDATSGAVRMQTPLRTPTTVMGESAHFATSPDGTVLELVHRFEQEAGPLRVWNVRDPATDVARVDERGISDPRFWPGRTEIVFTGRAGFAALDYRSGRTRPLTGPRAVLEAVESSGRFALVRTDVGLEIVERIGDELKVRTDLQLTAGSTLNPLGIVYP